MAFKEKLTTLRKEHGLSQEEMAKKLGVSRQAVSKWERGAALPSAENLAAVSGLFHMPMELLLALDEQAAGQAERTVGPEQAVQDHEPLYGKGEDIMAAKTTSVGNIFGKILLGILALFTLCAPLFYGYAALSLAGKMVSFPWGSLLYMALRTLRLAAAVAFGLHLRKKYRAALCAHETARKWIGAGALLCALLLLHQPALIYFMYWTLGDRLMLTYPQNGPLLPSILWETYMNGDLLWALLWCTAAVCVSIRLPKKVQALRE